QNSKPDNMRFFKRLQWHLAFWGFFSLFHLSGAIIYHEQMVWKEMWMPWLTPKLILIGMVYSNFYLLMHLAMKKKYYLLYAVLLFIVVLIFSVVGSYWDAYYHNIV